MASSRTRQVTSRAVVVAALIGAALAAAVSACARQRPQAHQVAVRDFLFQPETLVVTQGDTIVWTNADFVPHTATARDTSWDSKSLAAGATWSFVARTPGQFAYYCVFHPNMQGVIEVR